MFVDGANYNGLCGDPPCPVNNTGCYAALNDSYFFVGLNSGASFKLSSVRAASLCRLAEVPWAAASTPKG